MIRHNDVSGRVINTSFVLERLMNVNCDLFNCDQVKRKVGLHAYSKREAMKCLSIREM